MGKPTSWEVACDFWMRVEPVTIYDYDTSASGDVPVRLLQGYQVCMMIYCHKGFNALGKADGNEHLIYWAHVRRCVVDAVRVQPKG